MRKALWLLAVLCVVGCSSGKKTEQAGTGSMMIPGFNRNRRGGTLTDNEMTILRLDGMDGKTLAVFVNYTAHPTFMNEKDFYLSADWPGYMQR